MVIGFFNYYVTKNWLRNLRKWVTTDTFVFFDNLNFVIDLFNTDILLLLLYFRRTTIIHNVFSHRFRMYVALLNLKKSKLRGKLTHVCLIVLGVESD